MYNTWHRSIHTSSYMHLSTCLSSWSPVHVNPKLYLHKPHTYIHPYLPTHYTSSTYIIMYRKWIILLAPKPLQAYVALASICVAEGSSKGPPLAPREGPMFISQLSLHLQGSY